MTEMTMTEKMNREGAKEGLKILAHFDEITKNPGQVSEALLMKLLADNADTEYGRKYGFSRIHSISDYQKALPIITYDDIDADVERMKAGEENILISYHYRHMNETSGTVGKQKAVPLTDQQSAVFMKYNNQYANGIVAQYFGDECMKSRIFTPSEGNHRDLPCGVTIGCASSIMAEALKGGYEPYSSMMKALYTSPVEAMQPGPDVNTRYIHVRFAMMDKDLAGIIGGFMSNLIHLMTYIHDNYELLIDDIEKGTIDDSIEMPAERRESLLKKIQPMPERAAELREIFKDGPDICFMPLIWPKMKYIYAVGGDGFAVYDDNMRTHFHGGRIHNIYAGITASEGLWSVPAGVDDQDSILVPDSAFMEFQPVEYGDDFSHITTIDKLELGKTYELVITNLCGFYRYRMSDAIKVTGFYNKTPKVQFMYRVNKTINMACEKTTEAMLKITAENTAKELGFGLLDYEVYADTSAVPGRYIFMIETYDEKRFSIPKEELDRVVLEKLCEANPEFKECYEEHLIQAPDAYFEQPETQLLFRDKMIYKGASAQQLKPVHVIGNEEQRKFFMIMRELDE